MQERSKWDFSDPKKKAIYVASIGKIDEIFAEKSELIEAEEKKIAALLPDWKKIEILYELEGKKAPAIVYNNALSYVQHQCGKLEDACGTEPARCDIEACFEAAEIHADNVKTKQRGNEELLAQVNAYHQKACSAKYQTSCVKLGRNFYLGRGIAKDQHKAVDLYDQACKAENPNGCNALGWSYYEPENGSKPDLDKAVLNFEKACWEMAYLNACDSLGNLLIVMSRNERDQSEADKLEEKAVNALTYACGRTEIRACINLANLHSGAKVSEFVK